MYVITYSRTTYKGTIDCGVLEIVGTKSGEEIAINNTIDDLRVEGYRIIEKKDNAILLSATMSSGRVSYYMIKSEFFVTNNPYTSKYL